MQAYEGALKAGDTRLLLSPDSQFFQYFNNAFGKPAAATSGEGAKPSERPNPPAGEGESEGPEGAGTEDDGSTQNDASAGDSLGPQTP
jgi:hypothetical protein